MDKREIYRKVYNHEISAEEAMRLLKGDMDEFPLSENQKSLLMSQMLYPKSTAYNLPIPIIINEDVDATIINTVGHKLVKRHPLLRAHIDTHAEASLHPTQTISQNDSFHYEEFDFSMEKSQLLADKVIEVFKQPYDIAKDDFLRLYRIKLKEQKYLVLIVVHHIIADGASLSILARDFVYFYNEAKGITMQQMTEPRGRYHEFVTWQQELLESDFGKKMEAYWTTHIEADYEKIELPRDYSLKEENDFRGATYVEILDEKTLTELRNLAKECNASLYVVTLAAFYILLSRYSGQSSLQIGSPMYGRPNANYADCIGYFSNIMVLNSKIDDELHFKDYVATVKESVYHALDYCYYPLNKIAEKMNKSSVQLFSVIFAVQAFIKDMEMDESQTIFGHTSEEEKQLVDAIQQEGAFELFLEIQEGRKQATMAFKYQTGVYEEDTIRRIAKNYVHLLRDIVANHNKPIYEIDCVCEEEKRFLLDVVNDSADNIPTECVHETIERMARLYPDKIALIYKEQSITYLQLSNYTTYVAKLIQEKGIKPGEVVGVYLGRCLEWLIAMIGIFKAGAIYLPLDFKAPKERIKFIMEETEMKLAFTDSIRRAIQDEVSVELLVLEDHLKEASIDMNGFLEYESHVKFDDVAYIIYTSGSTGTPKGVQVWHEGFANTVNTLTHRPGIDSTEHGIAIATMCFDMSLVETMPVLYMGGTVEIIPSETIDDGIKLARYLESCGGTFMSATPSTYEILYAAGFKNRTIQKAWVGGESLTSKVASKMLNSFEQVWNIFGPTESSMLVTVHHITDSNAIEVGTPLGNFKMYVLDQHNQLLPLGAKGELYIGGKGILKPCYYKNEENNTKKFIQNPFKTSDYLYKSGDLVSILKSGILHFYCRLDGMVKFRGLRIELDEIDSAISKLDGIRNVASVIRSDGGNHKEIVSFLMFHENHITMTADDMKVELKKWVPNYMVPSNFIALETMPLLVNLKINKKYLSNADLDEIMNEYHGVEVNSNVTVGLVEQEEEDLEEEVYEEVVSDDVDTLLELVTVDVKKIIVTTMNAYDQELHVDELTDNTALEKLGFDSVRYVSLAIQINEFYQIEISPGSFSSVRTIRQLAIQLVSSYHEQVVALHKQDLIKIEKVQKGPQSAKKEFLEETESGVAIIGLACDFGGATNEDVWLNNIEKLPIPTVVSDDREICTELHGRKAFFTECIWDFDPSYYDMEQEKAKMLSPQLRKLMMLTSQVFHEESIAMESLTNQNVGVYLGSTREEYNKFLTNHGIDSTNRLGSQGYLAMNYSKLFGFHGPTKTVDASLSSCESLEAAVNGILTGQCNVAIAGASNLYLTEERFMELEQDGRLTSNSEENPCEGVVPGEGSVILLLKSFKQAKKDKDHIYLVIKDMKSRTDATADIFPRKQVLQQLLEDVYQDKIEIAHQVSHVETLGFGTKYCDEVTNKVHQEYFGDTLECKTSRYELGDMEAASIYGAIAKIIAMAKDKPSTLYGITEVGRYGMNSHVLLESVENEVTKPEVQELELELEEIKPQKAKVLHEITTHTPQILGISNDGIPLNRMMNYWLDAKNNKEPLPLGSTFLTDSLFHKEDSNRMVHMLVTVPSIEKKFEVIIKGTGSPLLIMPGFGLTISQFIPQLMAWPLECQMICIHPPGVGLSEECEDISFEAISQYYIEILDILGITEKIHVLGTSWGGVLAQFFVKQYQNRCQTMILANTSSELQIDTHVGLKEMINEDFGNVNAEEALRMFDESTSITERISYRYEEVLSSGNGKTGEFLQKIDIPTLLIAGGKDTLIPVDSLQSIQRKVTHSILSVIESSGHASNMTNAEEFNNICKDFLSKNSVKSIGTINQLKNLQRIKKQMKNM